MKVICNCLGAVFPSCMHYSKWGSCPQLVYQFTPDRLEPEVPARICNVISHGSRQSGVCMVLAFLLHCKTETRIPSSQTCLKEKLPAQILYPWVACIVLSQIAAHGEISNASLRLKLQSQTKAGHQFGSEEPHTCWKSIHVCIGKNVHWDNGGKG